MVRDLRKLKIKKISRKSLGFKKFKKPITFHKIAGLSFTKKREALKFKKDLIKQELKERKGRIK